MRRRSPRGVAVVHDHRCAGSSTAQGVRISRVLGGPDSPVIRRAVAAISEDPVEGDAASAPKHVIPGLQLALAAGAAISGPAAARTPISAASPTLLVLTMT